MIFIGSSIKISIILSKFAAQLYKMYKIKIESAPKTPKPDFSGLQLTENQQAFRELFSRKDLSEGTQNWNMPVS